MLPSIEEISHSFGAMLASSMDVRDLSRRQMATELNLIGQREAHEATIDLERRREAAQQDVAHLERTLKGAEELKQVDRHTIDGWENDRIPVSDAAVEAIIEVLKAKQPVDPDLVFDEEVANELRRRAAVLNQALANGQGIEDTNDKFSALLKELEDVYDLSRPSLASAIQSVAPDARHHEAHATAKATLESLPDAAEARNYSITLRKSSTSSELQTIVLEPGHITSEHIHLIEAGALPSDDLYALLKKGLAARAELQPDETRDLDRTFAEAKQKAEAPLIESSLPAAVIDIPATAGIRGITPKASHAQAAARSQVDHTDALARYTEAYMRVFTDSGLTPPPAEDGNEQNGARTEFVDRVMVVMRTGTSDETLNAKRKLVRMLRPLTMEEIPTDVLDHVRSPLGREKLEKLNEATIALRDHVFHHSRESNNAAASMEALQDWLATHGITTDAEIRNLNGNKTLEEMLEPNELMS